MSKIAIMQPYFFPYLGYFQLINYVDQFALYGHVDFRRRSFITRNHIVTVKEEILPINLNTNKQPLGTPIKDIQLSDAACKVKLCKQIHHQYANSPYFSDIYPALESAIINAPMDVLSFNTLTILAVCQLLEIQTELLLSTDYEQVWTKIEQDLTALSAEKLNVPISSQRVFNLCNLHNAKTYVNPPGGQSLYDENMFSQHQLQLEFLHPKLTGHRGNLGGNAQYASIIDVLMVHGIANTQKLL